MDSMHWWVDWAADHLTRVPTDDLNVTGNRALSLVWQVRRASMGGGTTDGLRRAGER